MNLKNLGDLRLNSIDNVEVMKGFIVGSQRTVIIKIPVIAHPQPAPSNFTWIDPKGQMINGTNAVLPPIHDRNNHIITSVVLIPEVENYGEYSVLYNGKPVAKIPITKRGDENFCRIMNFISVFQIKYLPLLHILNTDLHNLKA